MPIYSVTRKTDGAEVHRYMTGEPTETPFGADGPAYPFAELDHAEYVEGAQPAPPVSATLTKLEYLRRFTQVERITIRTAATQSPALADYLHMLELASEIRTDDPDTIAAVQMLEYAGLISAGRATEVLNG